MCLVYGHPSVIQVSQVCHLAVGLGHSPQLHPPRLESTFKLRIKEWTWIRNQKGFQITTMKGISKTKHPQASMKYAAEVTTNQASCVQRSSDSLTWSGLDIYYLVCWVVGWHLCVLQRLMGRGLGRCSRHVRKKSSVALNVTANVTTTVLS